MKVAVLQENFIQALNHAGKAVASRSTLPILNNVLIETNGDRLKVAANNLETGIEAFIPCQVQEAGAITLPAKLLSNFIGMLPPERVELEIDPATISATLRCGRHHCTIKGIDSSEFPYPAIAPNGIELQLPSAELKRAIKLTGFAAAKDEARPTFQGILFAIDGDKLNLVAADGFRLSKTSLGTDIDQAGQLLIPAAALAKLRDIVGESEQFIKILTSERSVSFTGEDFRLVTQLIEGQFPDYTRIVPKNFSTTTTLETKLFAGAVKLANLFARDSANIAILKIEPGQNGDSFGRLTIFGDSAELGNSQSTLEVSVEGEPVQIAFNALYLQEALSALDSPVVTLKTSAPNNPGLLTVPGGEDFIHVIMPMHIQDRLPGA